MASYLSYFTSNASGNTPHSQGTSTPGSTSTWSSTFSSRIAGLRSALTKDSEEDDPDNEDCSHVSNVLRAYYTEKGLPLPDWLPPDPKRPVVTPPVAQNRYGSYGSTHGNQYAAQPAHGRGGSAGKGGLSDLWDASPVAAAPPPQSLRAARPVPQSLRSNDSGTSQSSAGGLTPQYAQPSSGARPLPSQRAGSYQTAPAPALGSRDRLRARLQGGGSGRNSPSLGQSGFGSQGSYTSSTSNPAGGNPSSPFVSASEPWSNGGDPYGFDGGYNTGPSSGEYANQGHRQRPGGPR